MAKLKKPQNNSAKFIKAPITSSNTPTETKKPLFSFQFLDPDYCVSRCQKDDKAALSDQLRILGNKTWAELRQSPRHGTGYEKIPRSIIKGRMPRHISDDTAFYAFRFSGKKPMVGYRENEIFHIVWLDRDFTLYPHGS